MKGSTRRKLEMGRHALAFSRSHPDRSTSRAVALLAERLVRASQLARQQVAGMRLVRSASARKRELRRTLRRVHLAHLREAARSAKHELPGLWQKFILPRGTIPYLTFRAAAVQMLAVAERHKDVLIGHGLAQEVLESLKQLLAEYDRVTAECARARLSHVAASTELDRLAGNVVLLVRVLNGANLARFQRNAELFAAWKSASHVVARGRAGGRSVPSHRSEGDGQTEGLGQGSGPNGDGRPAA